MDLGQRYNDLCRLCASYDAVKIDIFGDQGKKRQLSKKIQSCLPFKVEEHDTLPKSLCYNCIYNLESSYDFRCKCIQAAYNLEKYLQKIEEDRKVKHDTLNRLHRIRPEVSIFAIPPNNSNSKYEESVVTTVTNVTVSNEESGPNPLDFVEVGVGLDDTTNSSPHKSNSVENSKSVARNTDNKKWIMQASQMGQITQKIDPKTNMHYFEVQQNDDSLNRRKNLNPRRITRENEKDENQQNSLSTVSTPPTPGLIAISIGAPVSTASSYGYVLAANSSTVATVISKNSVESKGNVSLLGPNDFTSTYKQSNTRDKETNGQCDLSESGERKSHTCLLCDKSFTLRSSLNRHFLSIHGIEPSEVVPHTAQDPHPLMNHFAPKDDDVFSPENMVESEVVFLCEVCRREFHDRASLWLHMVHAHREEASVSCGICLKICSDNITLIEHVNTAHSTDKDVIQRRYSCQVCGRQHDSRQKLLKHATLHTLIDNQGQAIQPEEMILLNEAFAPRECSLCHKKFFNEEKLQHHIQNIHSYADSSGIQGIVYKCELCVSSHATRMDRWWHMYHSHSGDSRVTCERKGCGKVFVSQALKDEHLATHHESQGDYTNTCEVCGKMWESRVVFYKHMMNVHPKCLPTVCGVCLKIFSSVPELKSHVETIHLPLEEVGGTCCDICGRPYGERSKMLRHRRVHNCTDDVPTAASFRNKDDLLCNLCPDTVFTTLESIGEHRRSVHQLFVCDLCPKFYNGNNHLWKHVSKQHRGNPNVTCDTCFRTSASKAHLERHKLKYHLDPLEKMLNKSSAGVSLPYKCTLCPRAFRIRSLLKKHLNTCKGSQPQRVPKILPVNGMYPCNKCSKVYELQNTLVKHIKYAHVMHYCDICDQDEPGFDSKKELMQHVRDKHANHDELLCDVEGCNKIFRLKADLTRHKLEHPRGYLSYVCEICGDFFSNRKKIRKHLQTNHRQDTKFLCAICNAILPSMDSLISHVHGDHPSILYRPMTCQICGKRWSLACKVVDHIAKYHGKEYKPCKICWKVFSDENEYNYHVENHPPAIEKPPPIVRKSEPKQKKHNVSKELFDLGVFMTEDGTLKRHADEELNPLDRGKRLRKMYNCAACKESFRLMSELSEHRSITHHRVMESNSLVGIDDRDYDGDTHVTTINESGSNRKRIMWTETQRIACGCCKKVWNTKKQLWQHLIRSHPYNSQFTCGICLKVCRNYEDLAYHLDCCHCNFMKEVNNKFSCRICGHYHNSVVKHDNHKRMHKNAPAFIQYYCTPCDRMFKSKIFYYEHLNEHRCMNSNLKIYFKEILVDNDIDPNDQEIRHIFCTEMDNEEVEADTEMTVAYNAVMETNSISIIDDEYQQLMETKALQISESDYIPDGTLVSIEEEMEEDDIGDVVDEDENDENIENNDAIEIDETIENDDEDGNDEEENEDDLDEDDEDENEEDVDENEEEDDDDDEDDEDEDEDDIEDEEDEENIEDCEDDDDDDDDDDDETNIDHDDEDIKPEMFSNTVMIKEEISDRDICITDGNSLIEECIVEDDGIEDSVFSSTKIDDNCSPNKLSNGSLSLSKSIKSEFIENDDVDNTESDNRSMLMTKTKHAISPELIKREAETSNGIYDFIEPRKNPPYAINGEGSNIHDNVN